MLFMEAVTIVTVACAALFVGFYLWYLGICIFALKTKKPSQAPDLQASTASDVPSVSLIVPVYNEASVISRKIRNLDEIDYPNEKLEAIFVDGGSTDGTADLIRREIMGSHRHVKIIHQATSKRFNSAVIESFAETQGDIICVPGAETEYDSEALNYLVRHFGDNKVGVVTGRQSISNVGEGISPSLEASYRNLYDFVRSAEAIIDTPFDLKGEISATRRRIVSNLVKSEAFLRRGAIDTAASFQGKIDGYKTIYEPSAVYYERAPRSLRESFKQGTRRGAALIENLMLFKSMLLNRRYGAFGTVIMPAHFCLLIVLPIMFLVGVSGMFLLALGGSKYALALIGLGLLGIIVSGRLQALVRTQLVLIAAIYGLITGTDTQILERLHTTRP